MANEWQAGQEREAEAWSRWQAARSADEGAQAVGFFGLPDKKADPDGPRHRKDDPDVLNFPASLAAFAARIRSEALAALTTATQERDEARRERAEAYAVIGHLGDALSEAGIEVSAIAQGYPAHVRQLAAERDELQHHADRLREVSAALGEAGIPVPRLPVVEGVRTLARQRDTLRARFARAEAVVKAARRCVGWVGRPPSDVFAGDALCAALNDYDAATGGGEDKP
jgi:hypothetical protein